MKIQGARILLVGASGGIGAATARVLAERGGRIALGGRRPEALSELAQAIDGSAFPVVGDITTDEGRGALIAETLSGLGGLDLLVNAAGVLDFIPFGHHDPSAVQRIFQANTIGPMLLVQSLLPSLQESGGRIVNVGSIFGSIAFPYFAAYSASKFALRGFSEALRRELAGSGIGVTYFAPRAVRTTINSDAVVRMGEATGMKMDDPKMVADALVRAVEKGRDEAYFGWPESMFVRINAILPRLVDRALRGQSQTMARFARPEPIRR